MFNQKFQNSFTAAFAAIASAALFVGIAIAPAVNTAAPLVA